MNSMVSLLSVPQSWIPWSVCSLIFDSMVRLFSVPLSWISFLDCEFHGQITFFSLIMNSVVNMSLDSEFHCQFVFMNCMVNLFLDCEFHGQFAFNSSIMKWSYKSPKTTICLAQLHLCKHHMLAATASTCFKDCTPITMRWNIVLQNKSNRRLH
jgi:hypothetical protein